MYTCLVNKNTLTLSTITMELIVASSRGRNIGFHLAIPLLNITIRTHLKNLLPSTPSLTWPRPSSKYSKLPSLPVNVYFLAGLPDVTSFNYSNDWTYQEVAFWATAQEACHRVVQEVREAEATVRQLGAIPCFCTAAPMSLKAWNTTWLQHCLGPSPEHPDHTQNMQI